ncbi:hypothetical protein [Bifidobacterium oedipodis]|uniref:Uncharacterized protein n=1 Tax=Bifidobacterium oedipodis TaxID=2675322 RepID=A0A7Y0EP68_9BIFI|nr:hypothetical protein [Bifidobacterium sp. DSM 109957]NMM93867.1 hypothetical protein [Bifidobacterium sp. DSM 109957]
MTTQTVHSFNKLEPLDYYPRFDGLADVRLRENIREVKTIGEYGGDGTPIESTEWQAEETYLVTDMSREQVEANRQWLLGNSKYAQHIMNSDVPNMDGPGLA